MSESMNENISNSEWKVLISKAQPFEWKGENSSKYLWNEDVYKAHTSGTPSDDQVGIPKGKKGAKEADLKPKMLGLEEDFDNSREMGSLTNDPLVKPRMMNDKTKTGKVRKIKKFTIESKNKPAHPRPINTPQGIDVDLITKAINILSSPPDEVDIADDINVLLKNWEGSGFYDADDDIENTNWNPAQRPEDNSIATVESEELESGEAAGVEENLAEVVGADARKAVVQNAKKLMTAAKNATQEGIEAAENEAVPPDEKEELNGEPEVNFDDVTMQKQLSMGHGRCPHKNQFDLCDKCGDGEFKSHQGLSPNEGDELPGPAAHTPNGDIPKEEAEGLMSTSRHSPIVINSGTHNGKAKKGDHLSKGIRQVTRKVRKNLEEAAEEERLARRGIRKSVSPLDNLIKALDEVESQLAAETMDYDGLMKALGSQINQLGTRR